jgi:hypothetical protein
MEKKIFNGYSENIKKIGSLRNLITITIIFFLFGIIFLSGFTPIEKMICKGLPENAQILDFEYGYSVDKAYDILDRLNIEGRNTYFRNILTVDMVFPVLYGIFLLVLISFLLNKINTHKKIFLCLIYLPFIISFFDILENILISILLINFPTKLIILSNIASIFTIIKFSATIFVIVIIVYLLIFLFFRSIKKLSIFNNI